jgi:hypothetical protein
MYMHTSQAYSGRTKKCRNKKSQLPLLATVTLFRTVDGLDWHRRSIHLHMHACSTAKNHRLKYASLHPFQSNTFKHWIISISWCSLPLLLNWSTNVAYISSLFIKYIPTSWMSVFRTFSCKKPVPCHLPPQRNIFLLLLLESTTYMYIYMLQSQQKSST